MSEEKLTKIDQNINYYNWSKLLMVGAIMVFVTAFSVLMYYTLDEVQKQTSLLVDCTTPEGECYKNGDRRSGAAVKAISDAQKRIVTVAAYCAKQPGNETLKQIEDCTNKELNR